MAPKKLKTMLMQNFGVTIKEHYGMLWYFLEWSIAMFNIMLRLPSMDSISLHGYLCTRIRQLLFTGSVWIHMVTKMDE